MNAIFGLFNLDGAPAADELPAMQSAMASWAVDGSAVWSEGALGLGCARLVNTPEASREHLPLQHPASKLTLTAGARLDNRAELLSLLGISPGDAPTIPDSALILRAYQRWGEDCVYHLDGDWHFAVWDAPARKLFLARDQHGNSGLCYYHEARRFAFASSKKALLALDAVPKKPNLLRIAQVLTAWSGDGTLTGYERILRLPPAHRMTVTPHQVHIERYWFPENISTLRLRSDGEYVEAFLEVFTRAVSDRLRSPSRAGVTLSAGLDSGAVTAVAASLLRPRAENLLAFTSVPLSDPSAYTAKRRFGDEGELAQATARHAGNVEHILLDAAEITPLDGIQRTLAVHDEPVHAAGNQYWIVALLQAARQLDVGALLTGQMGNAVISWSGAGENLLPLLLKGNLAAFRLVFEKARLAAGLGGWRAVRRFLIKPLLLPLWARYRQRWSPSGGAWREYSAIRPDYARSLDLDRQMAVTGHRPQFTPAEALQQRLRIIQPGRSVLGALWLEKGAAFGLEVRDPTQDRRLIEFCLGVPEDQFQRDGEDRWLIRRAMQGYLPEAVRLGVLRGLQAADLGQRVLDHRAEVQAVLSSLEGHALARQVLDLPRMAAVLASMQGGLSSKNTADCSTILLRGLMVGLFLLRF